MRALLIIIALALVGCDSPGGERPFPTTDAVDASNDTGGDVSAEDLDWVKCGIKCIDTGRCTYNAERDRCESRDAIGCGCSLWCERERKGCVYSPTEWYCLSDGPAEHNPLDCPAITDAYCQHPDGYCDEDGECFWDAESLRCTVTAASCEASERCATEGRCVPNEAGTLCVKGVE